jgi:RND family efflux transporter MFP subunit
MNSLLSIIKKKSVWIPVILVVLVGGGIVLYSTANKPHYMTAKVSTQDFTQEVSVTGTVAAANDVDLSFQTGGKVTSIPVNVGDKVHTGDTLAYVGSADLYATLLSRQAQLQAEQAKLSGLEEGARPEDVAVSQTASDQAMIALESAVTNSYVNSDNVVRNNIDELYTNPTSANPVIISFTSNNLPYNFDKTLNAERISVGEMLSAWNTANENMQTSGYNDTYVATAKANLITIQNFLNDLTLVVNSLSPSSSLNQSTVDQYKADIASSRTNISTTISTLNGAEQAYKSAQAALALKKSGSSPQDIEAEQAAVKSAQANVAEAQAQLSNTVITAPFDGTVTKTDLKVGQLVAPNTPVISMISNANFQIDSYVPEADIAKIKIGEVGTTTLDAYGDSVTFPVIVTAIDLSETTVEGVATYKTTLQFINEDDRIRSGMTANVDIISGVHSGVLFVPQTALVSTGSTKTVLVMDAQGKTESKQVQTGLIDSSGNIEILSGLKLGDTIVTNPSGN